MLYLVTQVGTYGQIDPKRYRELLTVHVETVVGSVHMTELRPAAAQAVLAKVLDIRGGVCGGRSRAPGPNRTKGTSRRAPSCR